MPPRKTLRPAASTDRLAHVTIECVSPELDCGRFPVKRVQHDRVEIGADIFRDGHDLLAARVRYRGPGDEEWRTTPLRYDYGRDRWFGEFHVDRIGRWHFTVEAWTDRWGTWRDGLEKKVGAGQSVQSELLEGTTMVAAAARRAKVGSERTALREAAEQMGDTARDERERVHVALDPVLGRLVEQHLLPDDLTTYARELPIQVDRERARFGAWYEFFPRSTSPVPGRHGTFADAERFLDRVATLGFDVVYLPPIHPVGITNRKGRNNALVAGPADVGSPWAIGAATGGHGAIEPQLGTVEDFERFVRRARELGLDVALDYALQCSPDHPWLKEHPEWFFIRPDGTIKYAENPPKKYQDIYPLNFWCEDREGLWSACRDVLRFWIERGVRVFRVDNPHTKAFAFWEWVIRDVQSTDPDVIFLAEAFTRPKKMNHLAKLGFTQSYTYFTWKNTSWELRDWLAESFSPEAQEYYRGNLFANTPDILTEYLVHGGRPAFRVRLLLAGTLMPTYGIYSGFELAENVPLRAGSEEYLDSEKYELKHRDFGAPGSLDADVARLNHLRREQPALQLDRNIVLGASENDRIFCFAKLASNGQAWGGRREPGASDLVVIVNLDPARVQETMVHVPIAALGIGADDAYQVEDLLTGARYTWRGARNYVRLDPALEPGHVLKVMR